MRGVGYGNGRWITAGTGPTAYYSDNGAVSWTSMNLGTNVVYNAPVYANGVWLITTNSTFILRSTDNGSTWTHITVPTAQYAAAYGNGVWVVTTVNNNTFVSSDNGATWSTITNALPGGSYWYTLNFGNGYFVAGDNGSAGAKSSTDGVTWYEVSGATGQGYRGGAYGNGLFPMYNGGSKIAFIE